MFEDEKDPNDPNVYFITNTRNLMSFLGLGLIVPAKSQFRYKPDSRENYSGAIPLWSNIPSDDNYKGLIGEKNTVIIELELDNLYRYFASNLISEDKYLRVVNCPIPMAYVTAIYMHSDEIIDDYIIRLTDDVVVDRNIFKKHPIYNYIHYENNWEHKKLNENVNETISYVDSIAGGIKALEFICKRGISNYSLIHRLLGSSLSKKKIKIKLENQTQQYSFDKSDEIILSSISSIIRKINIDKGIDQIAIFNSLKEVLRLSDDYSKEVEEWLLYVEKVLHSEQEVRILSDKGDVIKRGVLLFLLRPDIDRALNSIDTNVSPGPIVHSIAVFLAGYMSGVSNLGSEIKGQYKNFNSFVKNVLNSLLGKNSLVISQNIYSTNNGTYVYFEINKEEVIRLQLKQNVILSRVLNQARSAGYDLEYDYDKNELRYSLKIAENRSQEVFIELMPPLSEEFQVIRFVSPCMDLSRAKFKKLTKAKCLDFLIRNHAEQMYCSFAYSEKRQAIVVEAKQIVKTMDDDEFKVLLNFVGQTAAAYEREVLKLDSF